MLNRRVGIDQTAFRKHRAGLPRLPHPREKHPSSNPSDEGLLDLQPAFLAQESYDRESRKQTLGQPQH